MGLFGVNKQHQSKLTLGNNRLLPFRLGQRFCAARNASFSASACWHGQKRVAMTDFSCDAVLSVDAENLTLFESKMKKVNYLYHPAKYCAAFGIPLSVPAPPPNGLPRVGHRHKQGYSGAWEVANDETARQNTCCEYVCGTPPAVPVPAAAGTALTRGHLGGKGASMCPSCQNICPRLGFDHLCGG